MKKILIILLLVLLCACSSNSQAADEPKPVEPTPEPAPEPTPVEDDKPLTQSYLDAMEDYEFMEVALLGCTIEGLSANDILNRAINDWGMSFLSEIDKDDIVYSPVLGDYNLVYLFVPKDHVDLKISTFDANSEKADKEVYSAKGGVPFIYIEKEKGMTPVSIVEYVIHGSNDEQGFMYTGLNYYDDTLRTDYRMGLVDKTDYQKFEPTELPMYKQAIFDHLCYETAEVSKDIMERGYQLSFMNEMLREGKMYLLYSIADEKNEYPYNLAINYENTDQLFDVIITYNMKDWFDPTKIVG